MIGSATGLAPSGPKFDSAGSRLLSKIRDPRPSWANAAHARRRRSIQSHLPRRLSRTPLGAAQTPARTNVPVAEVVLFHADSDIVRTSFYVMEQVDAAHSTIAECRT
jgi:hypothetical protein